MTNLQINQLFGNLDAWRHLPAYQLERRADIFFSLYLAEVLQKKFGLSEAPILIPEFPVRYGTVRDSLNEPGLFGKAGENQSFKIDYLAVTTDGEHACFVELKTDNNSISSDQIANMVAASNTGLRELALGLESMLKASNAKTKYKQLLKQTSDMQDWKITPKLVNVFILPKIPSAEKIPKFGDATIITFDEFAALVETHPDYLSLRFAKSLREWARDEAGSPL